MSTVQFDFIRERTVLLMSIKRLETHIAAVGEALIAERRSLEVLEKLELEQQNQEKDQDLNPVLSMSLKEFGLSVRIRNAFMHDRILAVRDLVAWTEGDLLAIPNFGRGSLDEIKSKLEPHGLALTTIKSG